METRTLGQGLTVSAQGLGCMGMSQSYGEPDDDTSIATLHRALELGVSFWDTANVYGQGGAGGFGSNEKLLSRVLADRRDEVTLATKMGIEGISRPGTGMDISATPDDVRRRCEESLERLGTDHIDLYYLHRVDPDTPIEDTIEAMAELVAAGKVRHVGVSEVTADQLERAHAVHPITAVQSEWSLWTRDIEPAVLPMARRLGVGIVPFSPLGRGFLTGALSGQSFEGTDMRARLPRFAAENRDANQVVVDEVVGIAEARGVKPGQVALAWVLGQGDDVVPIPGTKRTTYLEENVAALELSLDDAELSRLDALAAQVAGTRY